MERIQWRRLLGGEAAINISYFGGQDQTGFHASIGYSMLGAGRLLPWSKWIVSHCRRDPTRR